MFWTSQNLNSKIYAECFHNSKNDNAIFPEDLIILQLQKRNSSFNLLM